MGPAAWSSGAPISSPVLEERGPSGHSHRAQLSPQLTLAGWVGRGIRLMGRRQFLGVRESSVELG